MKKTALIACGLILAYGGYAQSANDAGIAGITSPYVAVPANSSQPVSVTVKNFGTSLLTSATLGFSVNGVVQPAYAWTGNLVANATSPAVTLGNFTFPAGIHTVKAWSKLPNAVVDGNAANDTTQLTIKTCTVMSGNYTINKNAPVSATNFTSISDAAAALGSCGVSGPVILTVVPNTGPYNEQVMLPVIAGTSATNTVTFEGSGNTVSASPGTTHQGIFTLDGADYVKINNFKISLAAAATTGWGIQLKNIADNNIISNNTLNLPLSSTSSSVNGIVLGTATGTAGDNASNTTIQNNIINGGYYGIAINGSPGNVGAVGNQVKNNQVKDSYFYAIALNNVTNNLIEGNDISRPARTSVNSAFYGIYLLGASTNTVVSKNRVHNTHDMASSAGGVYGIYVANTSPAAGSENIIKNNLIYNVNCGGGQFYGLYNSNANGTYYYHNTISADNMAISYGILRGIHFTNGATNTKFINNIISLPATAANKNAIYLNATVGITFKSDYNDLFVGTSGNIGYYLTNIATLGAWKSNAFDLNSISADPVFVNPVNNMLPMTPWVNDLGQPLATVTDDFNGATRSATMPDMGAIEYTPAVRDAGITAITSPTSPVAPGSQQVLVTLKNFGGATLTTATVRWSVNGVMQPNYSWSGSLNRFQETATPVNIGSYNFAAGNPVLKVWSQNPNGGTDGIAQNDTTILQLTCGFPMAGAYTVNKNAAVSATNFQNISDAALKLSTYGVSAPVTITVVPNSGPYNEQVTLPVIAGTSVTNTVTFEGSGNTVSASPGTTHQGIFTLNGADYVKINNFNISLEAAATTGWGIQLKNTADNNIITNNTLNLPLSSTSSSVNGIVLGTGTGTAGNNASNTTIQNNIINGGYYGIAINGNSGNVGAVGNQVKNNQVKDSYFYAIALSNVTNNNIEGNDISRPARTSVNSIFYGIYLSGASTNTVVGKNRVHNTHDVASNTAGQVYGIYIAASPAAGSENIIKNNLIYNVNCGGGSLYGIYNNTASGMYCYHNTVSADNMAISYNILRGLNFAFIPTNAKFINNIISIPAPATTKHAIYMSSTGGTLTSDNNDLFVGNSGNIGYYSANKATLADWKAVNTNAYDQNSISEDPVFVNPANNMLPMAAGVNNLGQPQATVTDDFNGATRSATTPDMGAIEYTPVVNDAGITAITSPTSVVAPGSQQVQVTLKNFGTASLTAATVRWSVNGVMQPNYSWSGNLTTFQATATPVNIGSYNFAAGNHVLKVWSQNPNGATDGFALNDTTILRVSCGVPMAGAYTVNKNAAVSATNFQSISAAALKLGTFGVSAPVTVTVVAGSGPYNEQVEIGNIANTSAANTVTFEGNGNTVSTTPSGKYGIFVLNGTKYTRLNNFQISLNPAATSGFGVQLINSSDYNTISNSTINLPINQLSSSIQGIVAGTAHQASGNNASHTTISNNIINGGYYGIQINGNGGGLNAVDNQVTGNILNDQAATGIYLKDATGTLVESNDISRANATNCEYYFYGVSLSGSCQNTVVSKNRIHNTDDQITRSGYTVYGVSVNTSATAGNENIVKNNAIYNIKPVAGYFYGLNFSGSGTYFFHNTVTSVATHTYNTLRGIAFGATAGTNVKLYNNIIWLPGTALYKQAIFMMQTGWGVLSDRNDLYAPNGYVGTIINSNSATITDWKAANSNAYDQNSVSDDPLFANAGTGNLKPTLASLDNLGQPVAGVTDDILGAARNATTPDMGAFEFGVPANDVGIVAVSGPNAAGCGLTATENITVSITNFGSSTQTSVPVSYSVNGTAIAAPETWTGSLAPSDTVTYTFTTKANLSTSGAYQISARTLLLGDVTTANNADTLNTGNYLITGTPTPFDFETATTGISRFGKVAKTYSGITESASASTGTGTKGMIMDGVDNQGWVTPTSSANPWTSNANNFAGAYICISPANIAYPDSLWLTFDLKQMFKGANSNTNFRVTVNGIQVGPTYRPPFSGTPINWQKIKVDLTAHKNATSLQIGLESSVKEAFANGTGTANLIDNIEFKNRIANPTMSVKENTLASQVRVFPNPSTGSFNVSLENGMDYTLKVTDLSGKVILKQTAKGDAKLNLEGAAKGIYLLNITSENGSAVRKLIVE